MTRHKRLDPRTPQEDNKEQNTPASVPNADELIGESATDTNQLDEASDGMAALASHEGYAYFGELRSSLRGMC